MLEILPNDIAEDIRRRVQELIQSFIAQALKGFEPQFHEFLVVNIRQNARAFSNEKLAEAAGYINAEIARRV